MIAGGRNGAVNMPLLSLEARPAGQDRHRRSVRVGCVLNAYGAHVLIVTGSVRAREDTVDRVLALSLEHVRRSRQEPGCLLHSVLHDAEDPRRLVFFEQWADADALRRHFAVPASGAFVTEVTALSVGPTELAIYEASPTSV